MNDHINSRILKIVLLSCAFLLSYSSFAAADPVDATESIKLPPTTIVNNCYPIEIKFKNNLPFSLPYINVETKLTPNDSAKNEKMQSTDCHNVPPSGICSFKTQIMLPKLGQHTLLLTMLYPGRRINLPEQKTISQPKPPISPSFMALGHKSDDTGLLLTSPEGVNWTERTLPFISGTLRKSLYNGNMWVLVGDKCSGGCPSMILTSPDGINWVERNYPFSSNTVLSSIGWDGNKWIAVGARPGDSYAILTSTNGIDWQDQPSILATPATLLDAYSDGSQWIAVGASISPNIDGLILTSPDGITWTKQTIPPPHDVFSIMRSITWDGSKWIAVGSSSTFPFTPIILTSPNGVAWTSQSVPAPVNILNGVHWNGSLLVAVGNGSGNAQIITSPDGVTWTQQTISPLIPGQLNSVTWKDGQWVAVGSRFSPTMSGVILTSPNGIDWTEQSIPASANAESLIGVSSGNINN